MKPVHLIFLLALFPTLWSCVRYHSEPLSPEKSLAAFEARRLDTPGLRAYIETYHPPPPPPWPVKAWDLRTLTLAAFYYHPDLDLARARWQVARAATTTAGEIPNPTLDVGPEYITNTQGQPPWALGFVLNFPIETAGRRGLRVEESKHLSRAAEWGVAETAWKIRGRLRASLLELFHAKRLVALLERQGDLREKLLMVLDQRLTSGMVPEQVVLQARVSRDRTLLNLQQARRGLAGARAGLARDLGLPKEALQGKPLSFFPFDSSPPSMLSLAPSLRRQALTGRADLLAGLDRYAAAESALRLEVARQFPNFQLGPGYKWDQGENKWSLGISLTLPLFNRNRGPIAEAEAHRSEEAARFLASQAAVIGQFDQAMAALGGAREELAVTQKVLAEQQARENGVEQQFAKGFVDRPALLDARLETLIAEQSRLTALVDAQKAFGALEDVVQRPLGPEVMEMPLPFRNPRSEMNQKEGKSP